MRLLSQQLQVQLAVVGDEEDILPVVPALGHVLRHIGDDDASSAWHDAILLGPPPRVNRQVTVGLLTNPRLVGAIDDSVQAVIGLAGIRVLAGGSGRIAATNSMAAFTAR